MKTSIPKNEPEEFPRSSARPARMPKVSRGVTLAKKIHLLLLVVTWPLAAAYGLSQSQSGQQSSSQQQSPPPTQSQAQPQKKEDSAADAAKTAQKDKPKPKKIYTEDDLSGMHKGGVSVVGEENRKGARRARTADPDGEYEPNGEEYWRGRAQPILDEIAATDQQIAQLKEDIKKYGSGGFDVTTGMKDNIAYIHDRNGQIQSLENRKKDLAKQLDELQEEGRKAGASPAWFR